MIGGDEAVNLLVSASKRSGTVWSRAQIVRALGRNESASVESVLVWVLKTDAEPLVRYTRPFLWSGSNPWARRDGRP